VTLARLHFGTPDRATDVQREQHFHVAPDTTRTYTATKNTMNTTHRPAAYWINGLQLSPHPEGGFFKETYRSQEIIPTQALPSRFSGDRALCTSIYYLLEAGDFSAFHRIKSDELWHFYAGGPLDLHMLHEAMHTHVVIGNDIAAGQHIQFVVPAGAWFASTPARDAAYSLVGCTVSPGFDFADFEMAERSALTKQYSEFADLVVRLTR
jgi:predicted cupin superfamily sugar epimerase